jgi:hypothetical protein
MMNFVVHKYSQELSSSFFGRSDKVSRQISYLTYNIGAKIVVGDGLDEWLPI